MGAFYTNYTLLGPSQADVAKALAGREAHVLPAVEGAVVVFDAPTEAEGEEPDELGVELSAKFSCPVLWIMIHDDDVLYYRLFHNGALVDAYDSFPGCFDGVWTEERSAPAGGDLGILCRLFPRADPKALDTVLRASHSAEDDRYVCENQRHKDLIHVLGLSPYAWSIGYEYFARGELPQGVDRAMVTDTASV